MIGPEEIKQYVLRWWSDVLQSHISGESIFPRSIDRIGKVRSGDLRQQFGKVQHEIENLLQNSKNEKGIGYLVEKSGYNFRRSGSHELPERIVIESLDDYLYITGKKREWAYFTKNLELVAQEIPQLKEWAVLNSKMLVKSDIEWSNVLLVCNYFLKNARPQLYIRQLPIAVHTKFIEENAALLQSLLDFLIPDHIRNNSTKRFAERYYLKYDEPLIRTRILDKSLSKNYNYNDLSIPISAFHSLDFSCKYIFVAENKMNFLTLPDISSAIAIWSGGGFNISYLKDINWFNEKQIYYWGDIDTHGFLILNQFRKYFSHVNSILMDKDSLMRYKEHWQSGVDTSQENLEYLTLEEAELYRYVKDNNIRLEQEKISQQDVIDVLRLFI